VTVRIRRHTVRKIECDNLPRIYPWTSKTKTIVAVDGCRWRPTYLLYPVELRSAVLNVGFWTWGPTGELYE
jgi:hypothetical protein